MPGRYLLLPALVCGYLQASAAFGQVRYAVVEARRPGPTVAVLGLGRGPDDAVRFALEQIARLPITHGRLLVAAPRFRTVARGAFDGTADWPHSARNSRVFLETHRPEFVLVLAEDYGCYGAVPAALGRTISLWTGDAQLVHLAQRMAEDLNAGVANTEQRWQLLNMRLTPHPRLAYWPEWVLGHASPVIVTTSTRTARGKQRLARRTRQLRLAAARWLIELRMLAEGVECYPLVGESSRRRPTVAVYDGPGADGARAPGPLWILQSLANLPCEGCLIDPEDIADGALSQFDVIVFGGGDAGELNAGLGGRGWRALRDYVRAGGGAVGVGAGAALVRAGDDKRPGLIDAPVTGVSASGVVPLVIAAAGRTPLGLSGVHAARLSAGPVFDTARIAPPCEVWATYGDDLHREGEQTLKLKGAAAIVAAAVGHGRVVAFGPHCECYPGPQLAFWNALIWASRAEPGLVESAASIRVTPARVTSPHEHGEDIFGDLVPPGLGLKVSRGEERVAQIRKRLLEPGRPGGLIAAHRGHHLRYPENSIAAIVDAARVGAHLVAIDVRKTADGVYVLMHDASIERTTTGSGRVADQPLKELKKVRLMHGGRPTRQRVPTLFQAVQASRGRIVLEINLRAGDLFEVINLLRKIEGLGHCVLQAEWSQLRPEDRDWIRQQKELIFMPLVSSEAELREAMDALGARLFEVNMNTGSWKPTDTRRVQALRAVGVRLWISSLDRGPGGSGLGDRQAIDDPSSVYCRLTRLGFDVIETDLPELAVEALYDCMEGARFLDLRAADADRRESD